MRIALATLCLIANSFGSTLEPKPIDIEAPPHGYSTARPRDRFTQLKADLESGRVRLDTGSEMAFVRSLLERLEVPVESQLLVFSTTSLQLSLISPANPRALYFNEELYVGYVPRGKIEILSLDPDLGAIFYIFPIPRGNEPLQIERSGRCMNCHSGGDSRYVPGLVVKSVVPGPSGGSLDSFRPEDAGHHLPLENRFGGWYVTPAEPFTNHWGNVTGRMQAGEILRIPALPGERFDFDRYPVKSSDLLPHLLHEHQAGFVNRVVEATYRTRAVLGDGNGVVPEGRAGELDALARELVRYILFADEAPLPPGGLPAAPGFREAFLKNRRPGPEGEALKDLDLRQRLFQNRCSYMVYSSVFAGLPGEMKTRVFREMASALGPSHPAYEYLPAVEKARIRGILKATLTGAAEWL